MGERQTKYLALSKPQAGAINWGSAINSNFDIIDSAVNTVKDNISALSNSVGSLGYINIDPAGDYAQVALRTVDNAIVSILLVGCVQIETDSEGNSVRTLNIKERYTSGATFDEDDDIYKSYSDIADNRGFYIFDNFTEENASNPAPADVDWKLGQIIVKQSYIDINERKIKFLTFPQSLGGYYTPQYTKETDQAIGTITWIKTAAETADDAIVTQLGIPYAKTNGIYQGLLSGSDWTITSTGTERKFIKSIVSTQDSPAVPPLMVIFYLQDVEGEYHKAEFDWAVTKETNNMWYIRVTTDTSFDEEAKTLVSIAHFSTEV